MEKRTDLPSERSKSEKERILESQLPEEEMGESSHMAHRQEKGSHIMEEKNLHNLAGSSENQDSGSGVWGERTALTKGTTAHEDHISLTQDKQDKDNTLHNPSNQQREGEGEEESNRDKAFQHNNISALSKLSLQSPYNMDDLSLRKRASFRSSISEIQELEIDKEVSDGEQIQSFDQSRAKFIEFINSRANNPFFQSLQILFLNNGPEKIHGNRIYSYYVDKSFKIKDLKKEIQDDFGYELSQQHIYYKLVQKLFEFNFTLDIRN